MEPKFASKLNSEIRGGNPAPQIEWLLDNKNITKEANQTTQTSANGVQGERITVSRLRMGDIKRTMNGKNLTCVGVHPTINQSTSVELDVQYVPTVSVVQREYSIVEGSPLTISCQVDSNPPPSHVNWRLVSEGKQSSQAPAISLPTKPDSRVLEFDSISRELNQNIFECLAQNTYGVSAPTDVKLNVLYAPFVRNTSQSQHVLVGSNASLACLFEGNPEPEIRWYYADPLSRSAQAIPLDNNKQQHLSITNVTYRNEGDYHCEAHNRINGVDYGIRSKSMILDVYGEPQFLVKSPVQAKAIQGTKSDISLTFCSDPAPNKVFWQFGSLKLEPSGSLPSGVNNGQQPHPVAGAQTLPGGARQNSIHKRFYPHPLQAVQKRDSNFSRDPTCFEATLTLYDPEFTDQRDYTLIVQNERGFQAGSVRLKISSPLSPAIMITSAFLTICGLFLFSLLIMFVFKKRNGQAAAAGAPASAHHQTNGAANGNGTGGKKSAAAVEHLVNGNGIVQGAKQQQTRGVVNGSGNGLANGAGNPAASNGSAHNSLITVASPGAHLDESKVHMMSMASSDTSSGDQKQLLASSSDRTSSGSDGSPTHLGHHHAGHLQHHHHHHNHNHNHLSHHHTDFAITNSSRSTANSTPTPMNHISVDDEIQLGNGPTYQAAESVTCDAQLSPRSGHEGSQINSASIYANVDYNNHHNTNYSSEMATGGAQNSLVSLRSANGLGQSSPHPNQRYQTPTSQLDPYETQPQNVPTTTTNANNNGDSLQRSNQRPADSPSPFGPRSSVGATIAMMNSLAAAAAASNGPISSSPGTGVLNGAINQQLANNGNRGSSHVIRKPGPPKPPKPSIQQRSRFYQQQVAANQQVGGGLVMIGSTSEPSSGSPMQTRQLSYDEHLKATQQADDLAAEYSKISFSARAEL